MARRALITMLSVGLLGASCGTRGGGPGASAPESLDGRRFLSTAVLEAGVERPLVPGTRVEIGFSDGRVSAQAGCNTMSAPYETDGGVLRLVGPVAMTEMGCDPPRDEQDTWLLGLLGSSPRIVLDGPELSLEGGETILRLLDREVADPDRPLVGTTWSLETIINGGTASSVPAGTGATISFPSDVEVMVDTGCNQGGGTVTVDEGTIRFESLILTQMACEGAAGELEREVLAVLTGTVTYRIEGPLLSLRAGDLGLDWRA